MRRLLVAFCVPAFFGYAGVALAGECPGHPDALGTERIIAVDPAEHARVGAMQYRETLPLADKEVVLTFDDGPLPPYTARILQTLASECVKATFFMIGRQARAHPDLVRQVYDQGHTVASHSQNHPRIFTRLPVARSEAEIDDGIGSIAAALGDPKALAPFFRFPGLGRSEAIEAYLASRGIMAWSADLVADDWRRINAQKIMARALDRLEQRGKGVLLLHDIHPATVLALPALLRELKAHGYRIVHVVPAGPERPKSVTEPDSWALHKPKPSGWPRAIEPGTPPALPVPSPDGHGSPRPLSRNNLAAPMPMSALLRKSGDAEAPGWRDHPLRVAVSGACGRPKSSPKLGICAKRVAATGTSSRSVQFCRASRCEQATGNVRHC